MKNGRETRRKMATARRVACSTIQVEAQMRREDFPTIAPGPAPEIERKQDCRAGYLERASTSASPGAVWFIQREQTD